jgi:hypothetical protein
MVSFFARILQRTLVVGSYASHPLATVERGKDFGVWLQGLRERVVLLQAEIDRAAAAMASAQTLTPEWSKFDQVMFEQWLADHYPNESSTIHAALGDAWMTGRRVERELVAPQSSDRAPSP